jgi:hypothetical protein
MIRTIAAAALLIAAGTGVARADCNAVGTAATAIVEDSQRILGANVQDPVCRDVKKLKTKIRTFLRKRDAALACGIAQSDLDDLASILDDPEIKAVCG